MSEVAPPAPAPPADSINSKQEEEYQNLINSLPTRWEIELEFVQSLSNIPYVNYLAQNGYLSDPQFIHYLKYLQYWSEPNYSRYLVYPNCLHILKLLQSEVFRKDIVNPEVMNLLMNDMVQRWQPSSNDKDDEDQVMAYDNGENDDDDDGARVVQNGT
ncbi:uncharacterized protein LODBEIA_P50780 [Lodderomyces beijingensis]|uniref:Mediator of RNA polymerase II transcription subunit 31 n=1 Tax=Lodderomyces beijingensis TaxID=1775926 RepID=A0ABP0ZRV1_9ASCO